MLNLNRMREPRLTYKRNVLKNISDFLSWVGVALVTLAPIINPVSTVVLLLGISSHLSKQENDN